MKTGESTLAGRLSGHLGKFLPRLNSAHVGLVLTIIVLNLVYLAVVTIKNDFQLSDPLVLSSFLVKVLFDVALVMLTTLVLKAVTGKSWPSASFLAFWFLLSLANILLYYFGNTMVERYHFALIEPYSVTAYLPGWVFLVILGALVGAFLFFRVLASGLDASHILYKLPLYLLLLVMLTAFNRSGAFSKKDDEKLDRVVMGFRNAQVYYACRSQLLSIVKDVAFPALGSRLKALSPATEGFVDDYDLASDRFKIDRDLSSHARAIKDWNIPIADPDPAPLDLKPFTRIIYIVAESITLEALPCYNPEIKAEYATRFFCRPDIVKRQFRNLYTTGTPTLQGLTVLFNGHPNFSVAEPTGHLTSFPALLEKNGFKSVFIRSASKYFANENLVFRNMGFSEVIGREDFYDDPSLRKYIYGWGLEDRILYQKAADYIERNRDRKLFITVFGTDTHPPYGQVYFKHLKYPQRPALRKSVAKEAYDWTRAVDAMDHDIDLFIKDLEKRGLFDENTLIVMSADHSSPTNNVTVKIPGHPRTNLARIPLVFLSGQQLPQPDVDVPASAVDIAPTIFHLAGIPGAPGWWGDSLFDPSGRRYIIGFDKGYVRFKDETRDVLINVNDPADDSEKAFLDLFYSVLQGPRQASGR